MCSSTLTPVRGPHHNIDIWGEGSRNGVETKEGQEEGHVSGLKQEYFKIII